jgi:3-phenylpropionate/cinnamic acid dioxygenase small subunit
MALSPASTLTDREEIFDLAVRYATALDSRDWQLPRTCFLPDVVVLYEGVGEVEGYEGVEDICRRALEPLDASQHILSNFVIDLRGDEADFSCYLHAQHVKQAVEGEPLFVVAGQYTDLHRRTDEGWKIARRRLATWWTSGNPGVIAHMNE